MIIIKNKNIVMAVVKRVTLPFSCDELRQQHNFINYLRDRGFNTAKILDLYRCDNDYYEVQEYIDGTVSKKDYYTEDLIKFVAMFHKLSNEYSGTYLKKSYYKMKLKCRGVTLYKVLLGFSDKYFVFPLNNYKKNKSLIVDHVCQKEIDTIINNYVKIYDFFIKNYNVDSCVIHNDITSNNVIFNDRGIYLIDFDLSVISTEYVDFVDSIIRRYDYVDAIVKDYENLKNDFYMYIDSYNIINNYVKLDINGCLSMVILKLVAVHLYLLLNKQNIHRFVQNNHSIYVLTEKVITDLGIGE